MATLVVLLVAAILFCRRRAHQPPCCLGKKGGKSGDSTSEESPKLKESLNEADQTTEEHNSYSFSKGKLDARSVGEEYREKQFAGLIPPRDLTSDAVSDFSRAWRDINDTNNWHQNSRYPGNHQGGDLQERYPMLVYNDREYRQGLPSDIDQQHLHQGWTRDRYRQDLDRGLLSDIDQQDLVSEHDSCVLHVRRQADDTMTCFTVGGQFV